MDNLPIPQSRIENLMNAFISCDSGQISTPQSRVEEFWYHLIEGTNSLPIPQSRNELLLKKIIENDTEQIPLAQSRAEEFLVSILTGDINKLPIPQSRSEYYLDYIARNNLVLDDIEYLKYNGTNITATNTVQKPFRSAILKGQTLVNVWNKHDTHDKYNFILHDDGFMELKPNVLYLDHIQKSTSCLKPNTKYLLIVEVKDNTLPGEIYVQPDNRTYFYNNERVVLYPPKTNGITKTLLTTISDFSTTRDDLRWGVYIHHAQNNVDESERGTVKIRQMLIEYQEGMENWDIPYFEGMQSVKLPVLSTTGKNLFNSSTTTDGYEFSGNDGMMVQNSSWFVSDFIKTKPNTTYVFSGKTSGNVAVIYDINKNKIDYKSMSNNKITTIDNCCYIRINGLITEKNTWQVEEGEQATPYEPYKSNILSSPSDLELRGVGDIKDELNCLTGEVTERVGEVVLDGSESWSKYNNVDGFETYGYYTNFKGTYKGILCDRFKESSNKNIQPNYPSVKDEEAICIEGDYVKMRIKNISTVADLKLYLSQNPITIQYQLTTESIKTVDLKVVDQDDNPVKQLSAFDETTHIVSSSASDNSLIAIAEVEVPTKLIEALDNIKLLSSDVGMLIDEVDAMQKTQDENSTMTMSAMTELYEIALMMGGNS